jgi:hypothetical protein
MTSAAGAEGGRRRLPNRRPSIILRTRHPAALTEPGEEFDLGLGFHPETGRVEEIFLDGYKSGSTLEGLLDEYCIFVSRLLQSGDNVADLARRITGGTRDDTIMAHMLQLAAKEDPQPPWWRQEEQQARA